MIGNICSQAGLFKIPLIFLWGLRIFNCSISLPIDILVKNHTTNHFVDQKPAKRIFVRKTIARAIGGGHRARHWY